jgi:spore maturation protein CgeB
MKRLLSGLRPPRQNLNGPYRNLRVALIADELTRACLDYECQVRDVTPLNYKVLFYLWRPDLLFVESAWHGHCNSWKFKIAAYPDRPERNNFALKKVVDYARKLGIPCVFWNKEDCVHFERFLSSASLFDFIFTVDANCIERYRSRIGRKVIVEPLLFAVQPAIHYPSGEGYKYKRACFIGSYSHHVHERRRLWQNMLFSASSELGLTVIDRNSARKSANYRYPNLPGLEVLSSIPHCKTSQVYRDYMISLNVNTIEDSETMFSRRLIEIIACGGVAVTTPARSVEKLFKDYCHVVSSEGEARELFRRMKSGIGPKERDMVRAGVEYVGRNHTWAHRLGTVLDIVGESFNVRSF